MNEIQIHYEVRSDSFEGWHLCFQWVTYAFDDGTSENGYRFIWRRPNGTLQPARGQARIPSAGHLFELLRRASAAGWFVTAEGAPAIQAELPLEFEPAPPLEIEPAVAADSLPPD